MKTNPKSLRGTDGRFKPTGYNEKKWVAEWHLRNKEKQNLKSRIYYKNNKERLLENQREYGKRPEVVSKRRHSQLMTDNGIVRGLKKRAYTETCELCCQTPNRLCYHYWDDSKLSQGLWLCIPCHWFVTGVERGLQAEKYLYLKDSVENVCR